jgi:hypothetical protein
MTMTAILLILAGQSLSAPPPALAAPPKTTPAIYALVFADKCPKMMPSSREKQMVYEAARCRGDREVLDTVLRADTVSRLKVVEKQKENPDPKTARKWLEKNLRVESLEDTGVLRISFMEGSPKERVAIVNAVAEAYVQLSKERIRQGVELHIAGEAKICEDLREELRKTQLELAKLNGAKAKDANEGEAIAQRRNDLARFVARWKNDIQYHEKYLRKWQDYFGKPHYILLELAEEPPESK